MKARGIASLVTALLCVALVVAALRSGQHARLHVLDRAQAVAADGRFHRVGLFGLANSSRIDPAAVRVTGLPARVSQAAAGAVGVAVQAPVLTGERTVRIAYRGHAAALQVRFVPSADDTGGTGTPDFLRLHTSEDRSAFRGWFTAMAEAAADLPPDRLPREIGDCAALLRWCYRNALHAHDETWLREVPEGVDLARPSVRQYAYPLTPLSATLFRVREGAFLPQDATDGAFAQFADARTLWRLNTFFLSRDVRHARPGDLLFFRQLEQNSPYHSMIVTGAAADWAIYHTGPIGRGPGEMRRVLLRDLLQHPDPRWRPDSQNSNFLGVYRWNILHEDPE